MAVFLDEIGDMSANVQAKLLRALEERKSNASAVTNQSRLTCASLSATHRPLEQEVRSELPRGSFLSFTGGDD